MRKERNSYLHTNWSLMKYLMRRREKYNLMKLSILLGLAESTCIILSMARRTKEFVFFYFLMLIFQTVNFCLHRKI